MWGHLFAPACRRGSGVAVVGMRGIITRETVV
jgi:hypothetical protein